MTNINAGGVPPTRAELPQGIQAPDSIQAINRLTSGLFTVDAMWFY